MLFDKQKFSILNKSTLSFLLSVIFGGLISKEYLAVGHTKFF